MKTVTCRDCGHEFTNNRPRCPACGTTAKTCKHGLVPGLCAVCTDTVRAIEQKGMGKGLRGPEPKPEKVKHARKIKIKCVPKSREGGCIACRRKLKPGHKRTTVCPHCDEGIHTPCLELHRAGCLTFQMEREALIAKIS